MCGFVFIINKHKKISLNKMNLMSNLIKHRGPNDYSTYHDKNISVFFHRLSLRDLSYGGRQPYLTSSKKYLLCFNGEIYNCDEIKKKLKKKIFSSTSDTEILAQAFDEFGLKAIKIIKGMYSIVLYDFKKKTVYGIRDKFGIKPLYYFHDKNSFIFSSEIKPLLSYKKNNNRINAEAVNDYFFKGYMGHNKSTFFKKIKSVKPANILTFSNKIVKKKYYDLNKLTKTNITSNKLNKLITKTISTHLITDRKVGLFLSGGVDSTAIALYMKENLKKKFDIFYYNFIGFNNLEMTNVKNISKKLDLKFNKFTITPEYVVDNFDKIIKKIESPITSIRLFGIDGLYNIAKKKNHSVILEGHGSDEIFGGYDYNFMPFLLDYYKNDTQKVDKYLSKFFKKIEIENFKKTILNQGLSTTDGVPYLDKNFFTKKKYIKIEKKLIKELKNENNLKNSQYKDITKIKLPRMLQYTDRLSMSHGIETRVPFLDDDLANVCFNLDNSRKYKGNNSKYLIKSIFQTQAQFLKKIIYSKKNTITDPQREWFRRGKLSDFIYDNLHSSGFKNMGFFDQNYIKKYFDNYRCASSLSSFNLMQIVSFYRFYKIFIK